jgi:hypothetical protein
LEYQGQVRRDAASARGCARMDRRSDLIPEELVKSAGFYSAFRSEDERGTGTERFFIAARFSRD